jgi:hypothetical protein
MTAKPDADRVSIPAIDSSVPPILQTATFALG